MTGGTIAQQILADKAGTDGLPAPGTHVTVEPDWILCHDISAFAGRQRMHQLGFEEIKHPERVIMAFDHYVPSPNEQTTDQMNVLAEWANEQGITHFFDAGTGISHNIMAERGYSVPGALILGADSHTVTHGAYGAFATGIGHTDLGEVLGTGELWLRVPKTQRVEVDGSLPDGVGAKDLALALMDAVTAKGAIYDAIEFHGPGIEALAMHERQTLANITVEMGAMAGIVPPDDRTVAHVEGRAVRSFDPVRPDPDATYDTVRRVSADDLEPLVAKPSAVDNIDTVAAVEGTEVDQVFVGTCNNSSYADIAAFATELKGHEVADGTDLIVVPGTRDTLMQLNERGLSNTIIEAGGMIGTPGCGPCFGAHGGILGEGDVCVGTMNRNFPGRMGPGEIYLASPQTAAATAVRGAIADPRRGV